MPKLLHRKKDSLRSHFSAEQGVILSKKKSLYFNSDNKSKVNTLMFKIIFFVLLFTLVGCNVDNANLNKVTISHNAELKLTTKGWYLNETFLEKLSQVKESTVLSEKTILLFMPCYNVSYEKVVSTLDLMKELKINTFTIDTQQSTAICG